MFPDNMPLIARIIGVLVPILVLCGFSFTLAMIFSPKLRAKFMGHQLRMQKHLLEQNKDTLADLGATASAIGIASQKKVLDNNADVMKEIVNKHTEINSDGIESMARAIKKGLSENIIYCKHCGQAIDHDSNFCKECGKKQ